MACSNPIKLYETDIKPSKYNSHIKFKTQALKRSFGHNEYITVPCNYCLNCRVDRQNSFIDKAEYEYINYGCGSFVTFTYDDTHLFQNSFIDSHSGKTLATINKKDGKDFLNRLNKLVHKENEKLKKLGVSNVLCRPDYKYVISYEYGDKFNRPHFHCLFFGLDFAYCERLFWRAWNGLGAIQVGAIKNGGIAYCCKYISEQSYGLDDFYKYAYHHLERPSSSHSLHFGEGLYKSQLGFIKETGCYKWHNKTRPVPTYYKNKYNVISDLDIKKEAEKYKLRCDKIYSLYEHRITSYEDFQKFNIQLAQTRQNNLMIKMQQQGKKVYKPEYTIIERSEIAYKDNHRLNPNLDNLLVRVINPQGKVKLKYNDKELHYPLTNTQCMKMGTSYNQLVKHYGYKIVDEMFCKEPVPF